MANLSRALPTVTPRSRSEGRAYTPDRRKRRNPCLLFGTLNPRKYLAKTKVETEWGSAGKVERANMRSISVGGESIGLGIGASLDWFTASGVTWGGFKLLQVKPLSTGGEFYPTRASYPAMIGCLGDIEYEVSIEKAF